MFFRRLRDCREDKDLSQEQVAAFLNIDQRVYSTYETGKRKIPVDYLINLSLLYNTSVDYLLNLTDTIKPYYRSDAIEVLKINVDKNKS